MTFGERFLKHPDLFPARSAGETAGDQRVAIDLPDAPCIIDGISSEMTASLVDRYGELIDQRFGDDRRASHVRVFQQDAGDYIEFDRRGWQYELDVSAGTEIIRIAGCDFIARIELGDPLRAAMWTPVTSRECFWGVLENLLRPLVAYRLLASGGLLVHSAAIGFEGRGYLFAGTSGSGKSTVARLARSADHPVLSDDLNALLPSPSGPRLDPLPFSGDLRHEELSRTSVPLHAVMRLHKGEEESFTPLTPSSAAALLIQSAPYVNSDEHRSDQVLDNVMSLLRGARHGVLTFRREADLWPILRSIP